MPCPSFPGVREVCRGAAPEPAADTRSSLESGPVLWWGLQTHQLWTSEVVPEPGNSLCPSATAALADTRPGRVALRSLLRGCYGDRHGKCREGAL